MIVLWAWIQGVRDGYAQPEELTSGLTFGGWFCNVKNSAYDRGANLGQWLARRNAGTASR